MIKKFPVAFPGRQVEKRMFPNRKPTAYKTLPCATALACDLCNRSIDSTVTEATLDGLHIRGNDAIRTVHGDKDPAPYGMLPPHLYDGQYRGQAHFRCAPYARHCRLFCGLFTSTSINQSINHTARQVRLGTVFNRYRWLSTRQKYGIT